MNEPQDLFWKSCPVLVRRERSEERTRALTIRLIAAGGQKHPGQRVLRIYISDEADPFALHVLEVGEEEYGALRADQGIRVDFANFPGKLVGLLEQCLACAGDDLPRFQAVLQTAAPPPGGGSSSGGANSAAAAAASAATFRVVENNDFKQLPHIALAFRAGTDAAIKQFLAFRLAELRADCEQLSGELAQATGERNSLQGALGEARRALAAEKEAHERHRLEHQADLKAAEAAAAEGKARELADVREAAAREREALEARLREQLEAAQAAGAAADRDARALREQKYGLDARVSELSHRLGAAEGSNRALAEEVERLRAAAAGLGRDKAERDVALGEALTKVAALEDRLAGQQGVVAEQAQRMRDMEASLRQVEARAEELKAAAQGHEARAAGAAAELAKAQAALEKLTTDLALQREKVRRKAAIVARQEEELAARDAAADEAGQRARGLQRELERATEDAEALRKEAGELRGRLEDSRAQVAANEQMIRWLNNQVTETQLHYSAGSAGLLASRFSYRPPAPVPPAGSGSTATTGAHVASAAPPAAPARPQVSTYRTPGAASAAAAGDGAASGPSPPSVGSALPPGSSGSSAVPPRSGFRSSFYATHFGGSSVGAAPPAGAAAARSLNLGTAGAPAPAAAGQAAGAGAAAAPAAAPAAPGAAAKYLGSRFEAPTYRMADTAAGRVAVPVSSGM